MARAAGLRVGQPLRARRPAVIERLRRLGIGVEAGLASAADAERLVRLDLACLSLRILIEINEQDQAEAMAVTDAILAVLAGAEVRKPVLLHGFDATVWPFVAHAFARGFSTRVGLEDGSALPDGTVAGSNAAMVEAALDLLRRSRG